MPSHIFQSLRPSYRYLVLHSSCFEEACWSSLNRRITRARSSSDKKRASPGKSWTIQKDITATTTVRRPSKMKIHRQPSRPPLPSSFSIAAANKPPKEPDNAAAEKKMAYHEGVRNIMLSRLGE
ncbi:hypothetical protein RRF57_000347 [Xylaria bambusicola]|uniref:Uncharacterized protein n=1 Tax=Xylaria bambusicola TaxID=326684 RepID=A0AAN7YZJ6_9PEZI